MICSIKSSDHFDYIGRILRSQDPNPTRRKDISESCSVLCSIRGPSTGCFPIPQATTRVQNINFRANPITSQQRYLPNIFRHRMRLI